MQKTVYPPTGMFLLLAATLVYIKFEYKFSCPIADQ